MSNRSVTDFPVPPSLQFAALADDTRCALVDLLRERPRAVHELAAMFPISRPAISRHLRVLKEAGLIGEERAGRENVYALKRHRLRQLGIWLDRQGPDRGRRTPGQGTGAQVQEELDL
jgi:DNA-binding transcriptional ArsR family regulator